MTRSAWRSTAMRWLKFNLVGGIGIAVQLLILVVLKAGLHFNYLIATALAVEIAVIHNFLWHERFTWADRSGAGFTRFLQVQSDYWVVFHRRESGVDEAAGGIRDT